MPRYKLDAGAFNTRITLLTPTVATDAGGAQSESFAAFAVNPSVWARVRFDHGDELARDAVTSLQKATITIRHRSDVNATHAITLNSKTWKIVSPPENVWNENQYLEFLVERLEGSL